MFHSDISFSPKEKVEQFSEDAKSFLISFKDAVEFVKEISANQVRREQYVEDANNLIKKFKNNGVTLTRLFDEGRAKERPFTPILKDEDENLKLAKFT